MAWKLTQCGWADKQRLNTLLADSWEPFAVTEIEDGASVWLRREAEPKDAGTDIEPRRFADVLA